jgi:5-methylcytosine-specific restriction endonuclease McrA
MTAMVVRDNKIVLLNADMNELSTITLQKAARLLALDKAVIVEADPVRKLGAWLYPKIIRLKEYVYIAWEKLNGPPKVSKRGILERDSRQCVYCGGQATTIDHVLSRSRGGKNLWGNLAASCVRCNHKKGSRTPEEAGMRLMWKPYTPTRQQLRK